MATGHNPLGARAYISSTPTSSAAAKAFANPPPAIVQPAKQDWRYYENAIIAHEKAGWELYDKYKSSGTWKDQYKTWEDACEPLGKSRRRVDEIIQEGKKSAVSADSISEDKLETLKTISELPRPHMEEEPEKTRVKTARESIADAAYAEREEAKQVPLECPKCLGSGWIGVKPKEVSEPCKCGCVLTVVVCQILAEHGIPSVGLTVGQAGLIMGKIKANNYKLPKAWEWVKSPGEWKERQWRK